MRPMRLRHNDISGPEMFFKVVFFISTEAEMEKKVEAEDGAHLGHNNHQVTEQWPNGRYWTRCTQIPAPLL